MFVEMIDLLRCPHPHADSWLVAAAARTVGRHVMDGTLGCPVCEAEYPIHDGIADFGPAPDAGVPGDEPGGSDAERAMRLAALFGLTGPGGTVALGGRSGGDQGVVAALLAELGGVRVLTLDAPAAPLTVDQLSGLRGGGGLPLAIGSLRAAALDARTADAPRLTAAVQALAPRGRLLAPASAPLPAGVTEIARDDLQWLAERDPSPVESRPVALQRRRGGAS